VVVARSAKPKPPSGLFAHSVYYPLLHGLVYILKAAFGKGVVVYFVKRLGDSLGGLPWDNADFCQVCHVGF